MEALDEQIKANTQLKETPVSSSGSRSHNPGLRALMALKNLAATQEKDYRELLLIQSDLYELNKKGLLIIEASTVPEAIAQWELILQEVNTAIVGINDTLTAAKQKIELNAKDGFTELWKQLALHITSLKDSSKRAANTGYHLLNEAVHPQWDLEYVKLASPITQSIITHVDSSRVLLQLIERYTPEELNAITKIIVDKIPLDFTYEEAVEYQQDYYKALVNFKAEFKEEKNLWDKFLDILAGGTHQPPSERIMMERWLEGEKGDL